MNHTLTRRVTDLPSDTSAISSAAAFSNESAEEKNVDGVQEDGEDRWRETTTRTSRTRPSLSSLLPGSLLFPHRRRDGGQRTTLDIPIVPLRRQRASMRANSGTVHQGTRRTVHSGRAAEQDGDRSRCSEYGFCCKRKSGLPTCCKNGGARVWK